MYVLNISSFCIANQKELVTDLITKAKQIEYLINSLPEPEPEEEQVGFRLRSVPFFGTHSIGITGKTTSNAGRRDDYS